MRGAISRPQPPSGPCRKTVRSELTRKEPPLACLPGPWAYTLSECNIRRDWLGPHDPNWLTDIEGEALAAIHTVTGNEVVTEISDCPGDRGSART